MEFYLPLEVEGYGLREYIKEDIPRLCALANDYKILARVTHLFPRPYDPMTALPWGSLPGGTRPGQKIWPSSGPKRNWGGGLSAVMLSQRGPQFFPHGMGEKIGFPGLGPPSL